MIDPDFSPLGPGGIIGLAVPGAIAVMDNAETWNDAYGGSWFDTAMHEIGHMLGLGHTYDLPGHTIQGEDGGLQFNSPAPEPVFPGDNDIVHGRVIYRPEAKDIDMYRFVLDGTGVFTAETFAERLPQSSNLDSHLALYRENPNGTRELIARNDDYFSKDSYLELLLGPGTYYIGVTASGNENYDPNIEDSGMGGTTQGGYEIKFDFRKSATQSIVDATVPGGVIPDTQQVAFDGDADGAPGGVHNFWFRAAHFAAIAYVAAESLLGIWCPLTLWEAQLRGDAAEKSFIAEWVHRLLYYNFPEWVFTLAYVGFLLAVAATWWGIPPRKRGA